MKQSNPVNFNDPLAQFDLPTHGIGGATGKPALNRRQFLVLSGAGGLLLALTGPGGVAYGSPKSEGTDGRAEELNAYVHVRPDGKVVIFAPNPDVGQGVKTSLPMIVAEELDVTWGQVAVENAAIDAARYGRQYAGGSRSVLLRWAEMRKMGAMARSMLIGAAAGQLGVPATELSTAKGQVIHRKSGRQLSYPELAASAAKQPLPDESTLTYKKPENYSIVGTRIGNVDSAAIVTGKPLFGSDVTVPGMLYATYVKSRRLGGRPVSANLEEIKSLPGVVDAFILDGTVDIMTYNVMGDAVAPGIAIVAKTTWQALRAREKLTVDWDMSKASADDSARIKQQARQLAGGEGTAVISEKGRVDEVFAGPGTKLEAFYSADFVSHAQLEPQNCTAYYKDGAIEVWAPTQTPVGVPIGLEKLLGISRDKIRVHQIRGGGGFGRRLENDYVREAALISREIEAPVKLQWTREDDMAFDFYRPPAFFGLKAVFDEKGELEAWDNHVISVSADGDKPNSSAGLRAGSLPEVTLPHYRATQSFVHSVTPTGPMRAPGSNTYAFAEQSFIHELAVRAGRDHVEFLTEVMGEPRWTKEGDVRAVNTGRAVNCIRKVAANAGWGKELPAGRALGLSFFFSHAGHVAEIAEVSVDETKKLTIHKVWVVADIGPVINLSGAEAQCQGSVIDGISTLADQSISIREGGIEQANFDCYPLLRINSRPEIDVDFLQSADYVPSGIGEPALPPIAAAVCNAVFSVSGHRIRSLPISNEGFSI
jgi:isoquinoline 1-oxidoreductase beta subunit